jgi:hypothetical protein
METGSINRMAHAQDPGPPTRVAKNNASKVEVGFKVCIVHRLPLRIHIRQYRKYSSSHCRVFQQQ